MGWTARELQVPAGEPSEALHDAGPINVSSSAFSFMSADQIDAALPDVRHAALLVRDSGRPCNTVIWVGMTPGNQTMNIQCKESPLQFHVESGTVKPL
jgi:hypothetical protein